jgi:hypothetical protein
MAGVGVRSEAVVAGVFVMGSISRFKIKKQVDQRHSNGQQLNRPPYDIKYEFGMRDIESRDMRLLSPRPVPTGRGLSFFQARRKVGSE